MDDFDLMIRHLFAAIWFPPLAVVGKLVKNRYETTMNKRKKIHKNKTQNTQNRKQRYKTIKNKK